MSIYPPSSVVAEYGAQKLAQEQGTTPPGLATREPVYRIARRRPGAVLVGRNACKFAGSALVRSPTLPSVCAPHATPTRTNQTQMREEQHLAHVTVAFHSHAHAAMLATCNAYRAHRHGSESPYPGSTPGLNPCNHLAWLACGPLALADTQTQHIPDHVASVRCGSRGWRVESPDRLAHEVVGRQRHTMV